MSVQADGSDEEEKIGGYPHPLCFSQRVRNDLIQRYLHFRSCARL